MPKPKTEVEVVSGMRVRSNHDVVIEEAPSFPLTITVYNPENTLRAGFRQEWGVIEDAPLGELVLLTGAGLGNPYLIIEYGGKDYAISTPELIAAFLDHFEVKDI